MSDFVRLPPEGTGKRIRHYNRVDLSMSASAVNYNDIIIGDVLTDTTTGNTAIFTGWGNDLIESDSDISLGGISGNGNFTPGGTVTHPTLGSLGSITSTASLYTPAVSLADANSPYYTQKIDNKGSSFVRFAEGNLSFDAFGQAQFTQPNVIETISFIYGDDTTKYYDVSASNGEVSASIQDSALVLKTQITSGSRIQRTTNQYYPYTPGEGTEILMSARAGDSGQSGLIRRIGFYDDENGIIIEQSGSTFRVGLRSNAGGTIETEYVEQGNFNGDNLLNTSIDAFAIDFTKYNLYWMDFQWLGVGKIRVGTFAPNGDRVVIHTFQNPNSKTVPWARSGTLPFRAEQFNETAISSPAELRIICVSIIRQGFDLKYKGRIFTTFVEDVAITGSGYTPVFTARPKTTFNGATNRRTVIPLDVETISKEGPAILNLMVNQDLSGSTFTGNLNPLSSTDVDLAASGSSGGLRAETIFIPQGTFDRELEENLDNSLVLDADGVTQPLFTFAVKSKADIGSGSISLLVRWKEVQ